jgi:isopentenyl diphosphate isomerase/L-lactate dehydrogenase-like FMN-dependent dehydrogenase
MAGREGRKPEIPLSAEALQEAARQRLSSEAYDYVAGSAGAEKTEAANRAAFDRWRIVPRMLRDVSVRDLSISLFGRSLPAPILLAPIGVQGIVHPEGELEVGRAAAPLGLPFVLSTVGSHSIEAVAEAMGDAPRWFQLYWSRVPEINASFVQRAERAGYEAIVVTLDTGMLGWRERDLQHAYLPFLDAHGMSNYLSDPAFRAILPGPPEQHVQTAVRTFLGAFSQPALTWDDLGILRGHTKLPILLKGILHPDDAAKALDAGMDGIIVSNHGGRQVDGAIGALDALPGVVSTIGGRIPVLFDSGIRRGPDIVKALALGAKAVLLGRPYIWGLALNGEAGVREVLLNLLADLDITMGLSGLRSIGEIDRSAIVGSTGS